MSSADGINAAQARRGRELLNWSEADLALRANVDASAIQGFEDGSYPPSPEQAEAIRGALLAAGVRFTGGAHPGAALRGEGEPDDGIHPDDLTTENDR
ncbi:helix-turn-helix transcriptional regulator [uncultured Methylobacterium sp.]|uniref:helix-turn-helix domain-containing protein n=1 Tax=uncultured Methylobacterium sp. TaxID=157278 RepID=UPI002605990E|nr:helix-turn-helix transcriptional regulator [uncultured Methylobacterium sp.]